MAKQKILAIPSIRRLPSYLHIIKNAYSEGNEHISGTLIAQELDLEPIQVRKDLAITGIIGKPKRGYETKSLIAAIETFLGWNEKKNAMVVGAGSLGSALMGYQEFPFHGLHIIAAFDTNEQVIGKKIHDVNVMSMANLNNVVKEQHITIGIITVPSYAAQETADAVVNAGIKALWNFTNVKLKLPNDVVCQREDLTSGYAMLSLTFNNTDDRL